MKLIYITTLLSILVLGSQAQVRDYNLTVEAGMPPYLTGGPSALGDSVLFSVPVIDSMMHYPEATRYIFMNTGSPSADSIVSGPGYPIGFHFEYDGQSMDRFGVSANMYLKLANSTGGYFSMYNDVNAGGIFMAGRDSLRSNILSALQTDANYLETYKLTVRTGLLGYPGERIRRVYIFYEKRVGGFPHWHTVYFSLYERDNSIGYYYVTRYLPANTSQEMFCGLRGGNLSEPVDSNYKGLSVASGINTWATAQVVDDPTGVCQYQAGLNPDGVSYTFAPPFVLKAPDCPIAYFKEQNRQNPGYISVYPDDDDNYGGYYLAENAVEVPLNPVLYWSPGVTSDTLNYDVYLGLDSITLWLIDDSISDNYVSLGFLAANTRYYYRIVARNSAGESGGCLASFKTGNQIKYCDLKEANYLNAHYDSLSLHTFLYTFPVGVGSIDTQKYLPPLTPYTTTLQRDSSYNLSYVKLTSTPNCHTVNVWFDFNGNGLFTDPGEKFNGNASVMVPTDARLGTIRMRVMARNGCSGINLDPCATTNSYQDFEITIAPSSRCSAFEIDPVVNEPSCFADSNGYIALSPSGGSAPYVIGWKINGQAVSSQSDTLSGISTGLYQAVIEDDNGCTLQTDIIPVAQPYPLLLDTIRQNDTIVGVSSGGTPPYNYSWLDSADNTVIGSLVAGVYSLMVIDDNGCRASIDGIIITGVPDTICQPPCDTSDTTGIIVGRDPKWDLVEISPNPARDRLFVKAVVSSGAVIEIYDLSGTRVYGQVLDGNNLQTIDVSKWSAGLYIYHVFEEERSVQGKLLISR